MDVTPGPAGTTVTGPAGPPPGAPDPEPPTDPRRRRARRLLAGIVAVVALLLGAVPALLESAGPASSRDLPRGAEAHLGLEYAPLPGQAGTLDLFVPREGAGPFPVVLWSQGSGWRSDGGNVGGERVAEQLVRRGYAVGLFSVRSSSQATFPAQLHDAKAAVRFVRAHAGRWGLDPARIAAAGNSSGGWIAAMLGVAGNEPALEGTVGVTGVSSRVSAVVDFFAPVDFLTLTGQMIPGACERFNAAYRVTLCHDDPGAFESRLIGASTVQHPALALAASPLAYVDAADAPTLITHGTEDWVVPHQQSAVLFEALAGAGVPSAYYEVGGVGHDVRYAGSVAALPTTVVSAHLDPAPVPGEQLTWPVIADFLDRQLGDPPVR
ncbi:alpha/beta hydrolase [Citricoccus sp. SGAir0253]|uniref:alpha/beta hydrolase n=1 Tax=Citricoccus sp. SGAir0253 TaxID=2567881 RepID=UPI0010CCEA67|nr:alpha/beta hydrolase [Citricoccus sp. SGAir0253]QCU78850.1 alpha/beta hydrolase [Citricoccus sp. SGAir0253]